MTTAVGSQDGRHARGWERYAGLLGIPGMDRLVVLAFIARLPLGMTSLMIVLAITARTGSYSVAGGTVACYSVGAGLAGPLRARNVDRRGASWMLRVTATGQVVAMIALLIILVARLPLVLLFGAALAIGILQPPVTPIMRTALTRLLEDEGTKAAAFALESITFDVVYIVGPSLVAIVAGFASPEALFGITALFTAGGCWALTRTPAARAWTTTKRHDAAHWLGPLRAVWVRRLLPVSFLGIGSITAVELATIKFASDAGAAALSGYLIALFSAGSIAGGLVYGGIRLRGSPVHHLAIVLALLAVGYAATASAGGLPTLAAWLTVSGVLFAPMLTAQSIVMARLAPKEGMTESFAWMNTTNQAGEASAAAGVGVLLATSPASIGFLLAAGMAGLAALLAVILFRHANSHTMTE